MSVATIDVRPRRRRRGDAATASWRQARAVELALQGRSYDAIARELGLANRGTAWRTVQRALRQRVLAGVDELRDVELARLDALQTAAWARAEGGDLAAIEAVLRIMDRRARLLGLNICKQTGTGFAETVVRRSSQATR